MNKNNNKMDLLGNAPVPQALMALGIPIMIGMLINALYNLVDAYFIGGLGESQMGAISIAFPLGQVVVGLGLMFGNGAASYLSRLLGRGDREAASKVASTALYSSVCIGAVIIIGTAIFLKPILTMLGATDTIMPYALSYGRIYVISCIFNVFNVTMNNIVASEGAAKTTMCALLLGAVLNIGLDPIFIYRTAIIVTVVSVFLCMPVYAAISHLLTSALIDDSNRHLIGTETNDRSYIILKDGVYTNEKGKVVDIEELAKSSSEFPESRIVKSSLMPNFIPSSIVEIPTDKSDEMYIIPEIILINNSLCVLTQDNGKGWELTDKDNIVISFDKYKSDITVSQDLIIGYVKDGIMYEGEVFDELSGKYSFSPDEKGEYFFYLLSGSSDYLSLKSGNLEVN